MALVVKDRVKETTTTTGTGTITLAGAADGYQSFSVIGNANTTYYAIVGDNEWEVGVGTYTASGTTLSRDTVLESSNSGNKVNFSSGEKQVFCTYPAEKMITVDNDGDGSGLDADTVDGYHATESGWNRLPILRSDGVIEVGRYIDFHHTAGSTNDFEPRLHTNGSSNDNLFINGYQIWHSGNDGSGSSLDADTVDGYHESTFMRKDANSSLDMNNYDITNVNHLTFNDAGASEGLQWLGGNDWRIYESPDNLSNASGNLQFTTGGTRRMTLNTSGSLWTSSQGTLWGASNDGSGSGLDADLLDGSHKTSFGRGLASTGNTGATANQYYKVARVSIPSQYGDYTVTGSMFTDSEGSSELHHEEFNFTVKQQTGSGTNPYVYLRQYRNAGTSNVLGYVIVQNTFPILVDLYVKVVGTYTVTRLWTNGESQSGRATWYSGQSGTTTQPTGWVSGGQYVNWNSGTDGSGSGLDADTLDTLQASSFLRSDASDTGTGQYTLTNKRQNIGSSTNWDNVGFGNQTNLHFQGHDQFWVGAGNGTWFTGTANTKSQASGLAADASKAHDLLISTMHSDPTYDRGITFAVDSNGAGTAGWRLGKWHSGDAADSSKLVVDGQIFAKGWNTDEYDYYADDYSAYYSSGNAHWAGDTNSGWHKPSIVASSALQIQSGNGGTNSRKPQIQFHQYGYGGPGIEYDGPNKLMTFGELGTSNADRINTFEFRFDNTIRARINSDYMFHNSDMRSPIFYDSDNTSYYANFADATTSINANGKIVVGSSASIEGGGSNTYGVFRGYQNNNHFITVRGKVSGTNSNLTITGGHETTFMEYIDTDSSGWVFKSSDTGTYYNKVELRKTYNLFHNSVRSPIFYDSNNTSYWFNGDATGDSIRVAGDIVAGYSDERLKAIEGNIPNAVDKVKALNGFYYKGNETAAKYDYDTKKTQVGLSAQEVEAVLPEIVTDAAIGNGYKTVDYAKVVPLLVEAIKEQQLQIEELTIELKSLKE